MREAEGKDASTAARQAWTCRAVPTNCARGRSDTPPQGSVHCTRRRPQKSAAAGGDGYGRSCGRGCRAQCAA